VLNKKKTIKEAGGDDMFGAFEDTDEPEK